MKVNLKELFEERRKSGWSFDEDSNSFTDEMVDAAVASGKTEFAVILAPELLKLVKSECKFPSLNGFYVTGIFDLWDIHPHGHCSLITFSKEKRAKIRICAAPEDLTNDKVEWSKQIEICKEYYKELEIYINTSKIPDSLKYLVHKISFEDYRKEVFDVRYYSERFLSRSYAISEQMKKEKFISLTDLVEIIDLRNPGINDTDKCANHINFRLQECPYPLNENSLEPWNGFFPLKKDDIVISRDGATYLITEDSKTVLSISCSSAVLRLKSTMVTPEYLILYLKGKFFKDIYYLLKVELSNESLILLDWNDLSKIKIHIPASNIPMALDSKQSEKYRDQFNNEYRTDNETDDTSNDEISQEYIEGINLVSDPDANDIILCYMREVNKMVSNETYFGAGILIGSILEAFLTGWLGDMEDKNYFREYVDYDYCYGKGRPLNLQFKDAIDKVIEILKISKIHKDEIRKKMEAIRSMRDNVHARVHLKNPIEMTKSVCETALKDLEDIIQLRYRNFQMDSFMKKITME